MKSFEIKQQILNHLCASFPPKKDGKIISTTIGAISDTLSIEWNLVNIYVHEMEARGFVELTEVTSYQGYEWKVNTKTLIIDFLQNGGYVEENRVKSLSEQLATSTLATNKVQRISLALTIVIILVGCIFQGVQICISNRDYKLHKQQILQDSIRQTKESLTIDDLKVKLNAIQIELEKKQNKKTDTSKNKPKGF